MQQAIILSLVSIALCSAEMVAVTNSVDVSGTAFSGEHYRIKIVVEDVVLRTKDQRWVGLDSDERKGKRVSVFQVFINNAQVFMPIMAYNDLADVHLYNVPTLMSENGELRLHFRGSDGAGSYSGIFIFRDGRLTRRQVSEYHGQFDGKDITLDTKF